ncbi:MAG: hypothetical protein KF861_02500 [Planctomycetaceae bacterium]|nr:hypothetical protein [Planctomycetaceae bacterium]
MRKLDTLTEKPDLQREIADIFCHRARATLDMQRFDFMTQDECKDTLNRCAPPVTDCPGPPGFFEP